MVVGVEGNNRKAGGLFPRNCKEVVLEGLTRTLKYSDLHESRAGFGTLSPLRDCACVCVCVYVCVCVCELLLV